MASPSPTRWSTEEPDVELTLVDRRPGSGGHWLDAYPFVRLHTPSAYYGVNSLALGEDRIDQSGENAGFYERATGAEVRDYFAEVASRLTQTGRVRILTGHEHLGPGEQGEQVRDLSTGCASRCRGTPQAGRRPLSRSLDPGHARAVLRCCAGRPRSARQRTTRRRSAGDPIHRARVRQDGGRRLHLASGQRRGAGSDPLGPPAGPLVSPPAPLPAAGPRRRQHGRHLSRRQGGCGGGGRRRPVRSTGSIGAPGPHRPVGSRDDVPRHDAQSQ